MRKNVIKLLLVVCLLCSVVLAVTACKGVKMTISFVVDGETYATIDTSGNEIVTIPQSPTKDGYTFDGWYWDVGTWQRPFTANSLLNEPLTSNMSVYAKFSIIHNHVLTLQSAAKADCEHVGNDVYYTCTCGKMFADAQATVELTAVPTINKTEHTPTDWIVDSKANCTENGSKHTECSVCHATLQTSVIPATGHSYSTEWSKDERGHWRVAACEHSAETTAIEPHTYDSNYKCKICGYQDTSLHGTEIATDVFTVNGETLYAKVPNSQTTFSFINAIQVADGATFVVATDLAASDVIRTKTVSLEIGDNTYFILVENGNDIQLYTVTLRRRPIYTVTFVTNGGTSCDSQQVEEDSLATKPITSKTGYTFANWNYDFATPVTQNTMITASWTANKYTVTYDVNGGVLTDTQFTVTYDSAYTLAVPTREGHTFQGWYIDDTQIADVDGQSIVNWTYTEDKTATAKWTVNSYAISLTVNDNNAGTVLGSGKYQFGDSVTITSTTNDGYNFVGWFDIDDNLISTYPAYTFTARGDVKYVAKYNYYTLTAYGYDNVRFSVGAEVTLNAPEPCIGYDWVGWYNGDELLTAGTTYTFIMPAKNLTYTAERKVWDEMSNFNFTSTLTTCIITGVIDKTVTEIVVPNYVTSINGGAFRGCNNLVNISLPFIGGSRATGSIKGTKEWTGGTPYLFGYIFGGKVEKRQSWSTDNWTIYTPNGYQGEIVWDDVILYAPTYRYRYYWATYYNIPDSLRNVTITDATGISTNAFYNCKYLTDVAISDSVTNIEEKAFRGCSNLINVTIGNGITTINGDNNENSAFYGCNSLANINYLGTIESWCNIQGLYNLMKYGTGSKTLVIDGKEITEDLVIPDTVTSISSGAFEYTNITSVTFEENSQCTSIGYRAFYNCSSLENITIPFVGASKDGTSNTHFGYIFGASSYDSNSSYVSPSLKTVVITGGNTIDDNAFYNCSNITSITIPNSVTSIGEYALRGCSNLVNINYLGTIDAWCKIQGLNYLMGYGTNSKTLVIDGKEITGDLVIPNTVTFISSGAFEYTNITSVTFEENSQCTSIGSDAFGGCSKLANVNYLGTIDAWCKIQGLNYLMGYGTSSKTLVIDGKEITGDLVIPNTVTFISSGAFEYTNITSVTFEENSQCEGIGQYAFYSCSSLTNVTIPNSVTSIGDYAFGNCISLENITVNGENTKYYSSGNCLIEKVTKTLILGCKNSIIPTDGSISIIGDSAFCKCSITSIIIPVSVKSIGNLAFGDCSSLRRINYAGTKNSWYEISRGKSWNYNVPTKTVFCSNGEITLP